MNTEEAQTTDWLDTADIAAMIGLTREYVTDVLIKRPKFPKPVVNLSQRLRRWEREDVLAYFRSGADS